MLRGSLDWLVSKLEIAKRERISYRDQLYQNCNELKMSQHNDWELNDACRCKPCFKKRSDMSRGDTKREQCTAS